jgi:hypothetical protein
VNNGVLKIIGVIFLIVIIFSIINGSITHNNAASMPFGAFIMDDFLVLLVIVYFVRTFFKGFKNDMTFKEIVKSNSFWVGSLLVFASFLIGDVIHYLLK